VIVDTSAILAILLNEPDAEYYARALAESPRSRMSVANYLEVAIVIEHRVGELGGYELDLLMQRAPVELEPVTVEHAQAARRAWRCFGKGNHIAALNFGDCFAHALAYTEGEPLLFKGNDFALTDITPA